ncbi:histidine kinase [Microbacterium sp. LTA6]|uniref:sensor histidine kinase n=1 Tax=Microbacterium sp. LTA6 TaxID=3129771 RepID=UPI0032520174
MTSPRSRSDSIREDEELRLPRTPGMIRRFWARHPIVADVLIALLCLALSLVPAGMIAPFAPGDTSAPTTDAAPALVFQSVSISIVVIGACALLVRRRQWPVAAFVAAVAVSVSYLFVSVPTGGPLLLVTSYSLAVYRSSRACWRGLAIAIAALAIIAFALERGGVITFQTAANAVIGELMLGLIGALIGVNVGGRRRYIEAVIDRSRQLLVERDQQAQLAAAGERARIAREMHDIVSHSLTVIVALSEGAAATPDHERARRAATASATTARSALTEMRAMLGVLRSDDSPLPLAPLEPVQPHDTVASAQRAGYPVTLAVSGKADVSPAVAHAIARIVQEGVTNAMRHAPAATAISVGVDHTPDTVIIEILNDGVAGTVGTGGFGLRGLAERAAHVRGRLHSGPAAGGRWSLRADLPSGAHPDDAGQPVKETK